MYTESLQWLWWMGYKTAEERTKDKVVFYDAMKHFLLVNNEIPTISSDKLQFDMTIRSDNLFCNPVRTELINGAYFIELSDITVYVYSYELNQAEWAMYLDARQ